MSCSPQAYTQTELRQADTVDIRLISVDSLSGLDMDIGQKLSIPDMDIEIVRVSDKEVLVRTPVRTETRTRTTFVPVRTKEVDKRRTNVRTKIDNSVRTDTDNSVRTTDKSRTRTRTKEDNDVRTKDVDKSRTDSGNKTRTKTKTVDKEVTRNGFPWWIILIAILLGVVGWLIKNRDKVPFLRWLPF
jgi:hypothetical protein